MESAMKLILFLLVGLVPFTFSVFLNRCGKIGSCKYIEDCLPALNKIKLHGIPPTNYCHEKDSIVCCEDQKFNRVSEKKCFEYMENIFAKMPNNTTFDSPLQKVALCGKNEKQLPNRILGGLEADTNEYPHMVALATGTTFDIETFFCGGTLISEKFVLTAAHCVETLNETDADPIIVRLGAHNLTATTEIPIDIPVKNFIIHPDYVYAGDYHDLALLELQQSVTFNAFLRPACLPTNDTRLPPTLVATGWGTTEFEGNQSRILLEVELPFVNREFCNKKMEEMAIDGIKESQICYGAVKGKDTCNGDSGGPLQGYSPHVYCSFILHGVTSWGDKCGLESPGVYTNVLHYLDWIEKIVWPEESQ